MFISSSYFVIYGGMTWRFLCNAIVAQKGMVIYVSWVGPVGKTQTVAKRRKKEENWETRVRGLLNCQCGQATKYARECGLKNEESYDIV